MLIQTLKSLLFPCLTLSFGPQGFGGAQRSFTAEGQLAFFEFARYFSAFQDEEAVGNAYAFTRDAATSLFQLHELKGELLDQVKAALAANDPVALEKFSMLVIDSGNKHGDLWKLVYHPRERVSTFVYEVQ